MWHKLYIKSQGSCKVLNCLLIDRGYIYSLCAKGLHPSASGRCYADCHWEFLFCAGQLALKLHLDFANGTVQIGFVVCRPVLRDADLQRIQRIRERLAVDVRIVLAGGNGVLRALRLLPERVHHFVHGKAAQKVHQNQEITIQN